MRRIAALALALCLAACVDGARQDSTGGMTAAQIVEKNTVARGGAEAWRKIDSMIWIGHVESNGTPARFVLAMQRPNKTRFEVVAMNRMALRVYDGTHGWKLRPMRRGEGPNVQPYTPDEARFAHEEQVIDGPLIDYQDKGIIIALEGMDEVEGHKAYRLNVRMPSGATRHVWVDASTFLELKYDREARTVTGQPVLVTVWYRDWRAVDGLKMPFLIESGAASAQASDKLAIDAVQLNPPLDAALFSRPLASTERSAAMPSLPLSGASPAVPGLTPTR